MRDEVDFDHGAVDRKGVLEVVFRDIEVKVPDE
jgi:hypothetical protein